MNAKSMHCSLCTWKTNSVCSSTRLKKTWYFCQWNRQEYPLKHFRVCELVLGVESLTNAAQGQILGRSSANCLTWSAQIFLQGRRMITLPLGLPFFWILSHDRKQVVTAWTSQADDKSWTQELDFLGFPSSVSCYSTTKWSWCHFISVAPDAIYSHVKTRKEEARNMHYIAPEYAGIPGLNVFLPSTFVKTEQNLALCVWYSGSEGRCALCLKET